MRPITLLFSLLTIPFSVSGQTAEEILWNTQHAYRALTNYVDEGTYTTNYRNSMPLSSSTYVMAMDRKGNVNHWFQRDLNGIFSGAKYIKSDKDSLGTYTRLGTDGSSLTCMMDEASARLTGSGGSMFYMLGSLFYPDFIRGVHGDSSRIQYYDTAKRLDDSVINGMTCYVIKTKKTIVIPQDVADKQNFQRDSTQGLLDLPPEQRGGPRTEAGPRSSTQKYYIRTSDFMIIRQESTHFKPNSNTIQSSSVLVLNPKYNVKDFEKYLEE